LKNKDPWPLVWIERRLLCFYTLIFRLTQYTIAILLL
jgi:hypothetical protein